MKGLATAWRNPGPRFVASLLVGLSIVLGLLAIAADQPRYGLSPRLSESQAIIVLLPGRSNAAELVGILDGADVLRLDPSDLTPEPDVLPDYRAFDKFLARQDRFASALRGDPTIVIRDAGVRRAVRLRDRGGIPLGCWQQLAIGLLGFAISAWVWSVAPRQLPNILFGLSGVAMLMFTGSAAIYTTREIAIDGALFRWLCAANLAGASMFGVAMASLFLVYPRRIADGSVLIVIAAIFSAWSGAALLRLLPSPAIGGHLAVSIEMLMIAGAIMLQVFATRGDPLGRAALRWIGTATVFGAGLFIATTSGPAAIGLPPLVDQGWAFAFFLIIHAGVAIGLRRERLFAIDTWGLGLLFYGAITALFLVTDLALAILLGSISAAAALTGVILLPLLYLPLRDLLMRQIGGRVDVAETLERVALVALAPTADARETLWRNALDHAFAPLGIVPAARSDAPFIDDSGRAMIVPGIGPTAGHRLNLARRGRALFKPVDQQLATRMIVLASQVDLDRRAYERGVDTERMRVARDLHDDLAARLMSGLALDDPVRMRETMRASLVEVRAIVNATLAGPAPLVDVLADSRNEAAERLDASGIALNWFPEPLPGTLDAEMAKALTSALRELTTNVLRHSRAATMSVCARIESGWLHLLIEDDGQASSVQPITPGNGLRNIAQRLATIGGRAEYVADEKGFSTTLALPVSA